VDVETIVVGAGQAGLVTSWFLQEAGREHLVVDRRATLGGGWQDRWDAFQLVTPNFFTSLPGYPYAGSEPDGFMTRDELVAHFRGYAAAISAPVQLDTDVRHLVRDSERERFHLETNRGEITVRNVVVAGGPFQVPHLPAEAGGFGLQILQLHSHAYRRPADLPPGGVLLIGSGQTGVQLAEELHEAGRSVTLSVGRCGRTPRRYRGRDTLSWTHHIAKAGASVGVTLPTVDMLPTPRDRFQCNPHVSGHGGGHDTNLRKMAAEGIRLVGRFKGADGTRAWFAGDLADNLAFADGFFDDRQRPLIDRYIEATGTSAPPGEVSQFAYEPPEVTHLDLAAEGISTVMWTSGYRPAFGWVGLPIFDEYGLPTHVRGVTDIPGLTFIGLPWLLDMASANLAGLARDATALATRWAART
jgi:putative flavoprotein involved in K+ transport